MCALPLADAVKKKLRVPDGAWQIVSGAALLVLMLIAVGDTVAGGYNPFIYYNF